MGVDTLIYRKSIFNIAQISKNTKACDEYVQTIKNTTEGISTISHRGSQKIQYQ